MLLPIARAEYNFHRVHPKMKYGRCAGRPKFIQIAVQGSQQNFLNKTTKENAQELIFQVFRTNTMLRGIVVLIVPCCCKEQLIMSLCDVVHPVVCFRGKFPQPDFWVAQAILRNFYCCYYFFPLQKLFFHFHFFYAFLDVSYHPECSIFFSLSSG